MKIDPLSLTVRDLCDGWTEHLVTGGLEMTCNRISIKIVLAPMLFAIAGTGWSDTNLISNARTLLDNAYVNIPPQYMESGVLQECIDELYKVPSYAVFANAVTNDWREILANLNEVATNEVERLLIIGVGLHYDEDFYLDFSSVLCDMHTNGVITAEELLFGRASHRYDLNSCMIRRYQEPKVIELVNKYKTANPQQADYWDGVLSGAAYTNYLEEVEAGLWQ